MVSRTLRVPLRPHALPPRGQPDLAPDQPSLDPGGHRSDAADHPLGPWSVVRGHWTIFHLPSSIFAGAGFPRLLLPGGGALALWTGDFHGPVADAVQRRYHGRVAWPLRHSRSSTCKCDRGRRGSRRHRRGVQRHPLPPSHADDFSLPRGTLSAYGPPPHWVGVIGL